MLTERSALRDNPGDDPGTRSLAMHRSFTSHQRSGDPHDAREHPRQVQPFPEQTPLTVEKFVGYARGRYFEGLISCHIIPKATIQTILDPPPPALKGENIWGEEFEDESGDDLNHDRP